MVRIPLLVLFLVLIALTLVSIGTLVGVLDSLLADEAKRSAEAAVRGALEHAGELVAAPFDETVPLVRRMAADTFERNDRLDDGRTDPALFRPLMQQYLATIKGSAAPLYALYQTFMVAGDNNSWTFAGCFADDNYCLMYRSNGYITVAATYPKINTTITGSATGVSTWNYTTSPFAARVRGMTRADSEGRWGLPELFYDQVTKLTVPFITFHVPVFFDAQGRALLSENIDLKSDGLKAQLRLVKLPDTDVILVHRDQGTLLATTFNIPSYKTPTSGTALWPATATPSDALNTATRRFLSLQKESVVIDSDLIYGVYPVTRGTLRLMVLTVTKKEYFFDTLKKARIIGICVACGCGAVCVIVALLVTFLIHRALTQLRSAMGPASRLQMDPAEYKAQGTSFVYDIATLQEAFGLMNEKLHEAGSYLPQSVKAAWAHEDGEEDDEDDDDDNMSATIVSVKETSSFSPTSSRSQSTAPGTSGRDSVLHVKSSTSGSKYNLRRGTTKSAIGTEVGSRKSAGVRQVRHSARIAVLQVNLVGFHKATASMPFDTVVKKSAVLTDLIVAAAKAHKGILDAFQGDRYTLTFNAVTTCAAQTRRAVACALAIREGVAKAGDKSFDLPVSCGVASGMASIGDIGSTAMRRFGVLSHVVAQASVLERMCRQYGPEIPCVVAQNVFEDLGVHYAIVGVDYIRLPGPQSPASGTTSASLVGAVLHELSKDGEDDEWLYVVGSGRIDTASNALTTSLKAESAEAARCLITELVEKEAMHSGDEASAVAASALARAHAERLIAEAATCGDLATRGRSLGSFEGELAGHRDWVTSLSCPQSTDSSIKVVSASRDKSVVSWGAAAERHSEEDAPCVPVRRLEGHSAFVQDVALTNNGEYALSASWDKSLRLWNLKNGDCFGKFLGHQKDVLAAAFSPDNRHILSGSRDGKMKIWNVKGECVYTLEKDAHTDWVSCVRFSPVQQSPVIVSGSWDHTVKVWSLADFKCTHTLRGHTGYVSTVTVSPDGSLCASAGKDGKAKLWDLTRGEHLYELDCQGPVNQLLFSPNRYWLCAATESTIRIFDLESKKLVAELMPEVDEKTKAPECLCVAWSADGNTLYSGYTDSKIRVWGVRD